MKRRQFLSRAAGAAAAGGLAGFPPTSARAKPVSALRLTLIHTNDVHSRLEPKIGGKFAGLGGAAARSAMIEKIRRGADHVLLLDSGDILQGTPYFNLFRGEPEFKAMSMQRYDAATIGNHDFDAGIERLAELTRDHGTFPMLCANYDFTNTPMEGHARDALVREIDGAKIGIFGVGIKLEGLVSRRLTGDTRYADPLEAARRVGAHLRHDENCDFVICLSHINVLSISDPDSRSKEPGDRDLIVQAPEIDVILGGHNHFWLTERYPRPTGLGIVNQTGWAGTHLGLLEFDVFGRNRIRLARHGAIAAA